MFSASLVNTAKKRKSSYFDFQNLNDLLACHRYVDGTCGLLSTVFLSSKGQMAFFSSRFLIGCNCFLILTFRFYNASVV